MECLEGCFGFAATTRPKFGGIVPDSIPSAKVDAATKLEGNMTMVVQDITNPGAAGLKGNALTQLHLQRLSRSDERSVQNMVKAACNLLRGKEIGAPPPPEAMVWEKAAKFLGGRVQGSKAECPGREPDMSAASAAALCAVLGRIEVASKLIHNREVVAKDITNPGPRAVKGGLLTQTTLKRLDPKNEGTVLQMLDEVSNRLLGRGSPLPSGEVALVWADAAGFFAGRIQGPSDQSRIVIPDYKKRTEDMSSAAASALSTTLGKMEAAIRLTSNLEFVVQDITNPGPQGLKGGALTQTNLTRVDPKDQGSVQKMVEGVCARLLGQQVSGPSTQEEAKVWLAAATFLGGRIQKSREDCPTRQPDMSISAGTAMQTAVGEIEASSKLTSNRDTVVNDICNPGGSAVLGGSVTQKNLRRCAPAEQPSVQAMVREVSGRLLGKKASEPGPSDVQVWAKAATYLDQRIQSTANEMPGRAPDMSVAAATAMRTVLAQL